MTVLAGQLHMVGAYIDGKVSEARLDGVYGLARDQAGLLYATTYTFPFTARWDESNPIEPNTHAVRLIRPDGIFTIAGGNPGFADGSGIESRINTPTGIALGTDGQIYIADTGNHRIRAIRFTP